MKKLLSFTVVFLIIFFSLFYVCAHSGKTDSNGGHFDRSTGEYHYHHGYSAHQHTNGKCPYDFDDKTGENSGSSKTSTSTTSDLIALSSSKYKNLAKERLIYIVVLSVVLSVVLLIVLIILFRTNNRKNESEEELKKLKAKYKDETEEFKNLKTDYSKKTILCCELSIENEKLKKEIIKMDSSHFVEIDNEKLKIRKYIASHHGLVAFRIYPDESISDYFIRIFESGNKNPLHFANPQFRGRRHEIQSLKYANFIKEKYEAKGYEVILFESKCTTEKYLFAYNSTNYLLIQCILTQDELTDVEHIQALNNTLIDLGLITKIDNINAVLICSCSISDEVKEALSVHNFNYRENIELSKK